MLKKQLRSEAFLWIHLCGIVLFPVWLTIVWAALATGNNFNPIWELLLLVALGITPVFLMQLIRPFNIFSILLVAIKEESLEESQKEILTLFKSWRQSLVSAIATVMLILLLGLIYSLAPLAVGITNFLPQWRILSLAIAILALLASSLFLQVPLSVLLVLSTNQAQLDKIQPYPMEKIAQNFTSLGIKVSKILWFLNSEEPENSVELP